MRRTTADQSQGVRWTLLPTLEDQDFLDDLALVSHTHHHVHEKTSWVSTHTQRVGLKISRKETEVMIQNVSNPKLVQVNWENLPITQEFIYLGGTVRYDVGTGSDIKNRLNKARNALTMPINVWRSSQ